MWWLCSLVLLLFHLLGHALVVRLVGGQPSEIILTGVGGHCRWNGNVSPLGRGAIACGGIGAQLCIWGLGMAFAFWAHDGLALGDSGQAIFTVATFSNAWLMGLNLVPLAPLDGSEAWSFPFLLGQAARLRWSRGAGIVSQLESHPGAEAKAKALAAHLLENARSGNQPP